MEGAGRKKQLLFALVIAVVAVWVNKVYIQTQVDQWKPQQVVSFARAKKAVRAGEPLRRKDIERAEVSKKFAPRVAIPYKEIEAYLGQELMVDVPSGDYILENYFSIRRAVGNKLSDQVIGENVRAITLPVDQMDSLAGSIVTGDRIDIVFTFTASGLQEKMSMALLQNVPVIATGSYSVFEQEVGTRGGKQQRYNSLTLLLPFHDAMRLNFARQAGKIDIFLRNAADSAAVAVKPISGVVDLLSEDQKMLVEKLKQGQQLSDDEREKVKDQLKKMFEARQRAAK